MRRLLYDVEAFLKVIFVLTIGMLCGFVIILYNVIELIKEQIFAASFSWVGAENKEG
jgi:hypothetical protein